MNSLKTIYISMLIVLFISGASYSKRSGPKSVKPVVYKGMKYAAIHWGKSRDLGQNGGYIEAFKVRTGKRLWVLRVYKIKYKSDLEKDVQDVFITSMRIKNGTLVVMNEKDEVYHVNLRTRKVTHHH